MHRGISPVASAEAVVAETRRTASPPPARRASPARWGCVAALATWLVAPHPHAEAAEQEAEADAPDPEIGIPREPAEDLRTGHWLFAVGGAVLAPTNHFGGGTGALGYGSIGGALRADVAVGISRYTLLDLSGGASWLAQGDLCEDCSAASYDVGLGFRYHLAQGLSFDPWIGLGAGYRYATTTSDAQDESASGIDVARLRIGGDYYPLSWLGLGPFIETDIGLLVDPEPLAYAAFFAGLRVVLDPMRSDVSLGPSVASR